MDFLYALTLIVAMAAAAVAVLTSILGLVRQYPPIEPDGLIRKVLMSRRFANSALALGAISLTTSVVVHSRWGHGPGTVAPMDLGPLLSEHEAFPTVGAILFLALVLGLYKSRRQ